MKIIRRFGVLLFLALAMGMCLSSASASDSAMPWSEEPAPWAVKQMEDLADAGVFQGNYSPTRTVSRGQFCYLMVNVVERVGQRELLSALEPMPTDYFADLTSTNGFDGGYSVYTAAAYGLTEGVLENGQRLADTKSNLTREQAAKMMCALLDSLERYAGMEQEEGGEPKTFSDAEAISPWAREYVDRASALGILQGDESGRFNPQGILTLQETCVMLDRVFKAAEQSNAVRDEALGIRTLYTSLDERAGCTLGDNKTQMYYLQNGSVLTIHTRLSETPGIWVEYFVENGQPSGAREIPIELSYFAGFYESDTGYYLAFGQDNMEENDTKEVYRIVRYDKNWNRLGAASVTGGESNTTQPFRATTHTSMAEENGTLVLHTSRQRYQALDDGLRHQSNITIQVRTSDMTVLSVSSWFPDNYVSHSFAQYVAFDGGKPVYADQGDAYPRGFALNDSQGQSINFFPFAGETGDNSTYAVPGGLGVGTDNYLFAGASSNQDGNDKLTYCNVFLAVIPKNGFPNSTPRVQWLTAYPKDGQEYVNAVWLTPLNNNTFVVMWQSSRRSVRAWNLTDLGDFHYAVFDGNGSQIGQTQTMENFAAPLNDPTVIGNQIVWARPEIAPYSVYASSNARCLKVYTLEIDLNPAAETAVTPESTATQPSAASPQQAAGSGSGSSSSSSSSSGSGSGSGSSSGSSSTPSSGSSSSASSSISSGSGATSNPSSSSSSNSGSSSGSTASSGITCTALPDDGRTTYYREAWEDGDYLSLEVVNGDTVRMSGRITFTGSAYNYAVLQVIGDQGEVPLTSGVPFTIDVKADVNRLNTLYGGDTSVSWSMVIAMCCSHHTPGETNLAGFSFQSGAWASLALDGHGGITLQIQK